MRDIRKISVGPDYKNALHYTVGQDIISGTHKIHNIKADENLCYVIFVENPDQEVFAWKSISNTVPVIVEYNIDFG